VRYFLVGTVATVPLICVSFAHVWIDSTFYCVYYSLKLIQSV
jgi:hypothetical protein